MKTYGQFCPAAKAAELFCERWTALIIRELWTGSTRFSEIQKGVPLMSPTLLSTRLKQLEAEGIVERANLKGRSASHYHLTEAGQEFIPLVDALGRWGQRWNRRELAENELDLGLLLWKMEQGAKPSVFGRQRVVIRIELTDQPEHKAFWWFINESPVCEMCIHDPGYDVDIYLSTNLRVLTHLVRGDIGLSEAQERYETEATGDLPLLRKLPNWLNMNPWSGISHATTAKM